MPESELLIMAMTRMQSGICTAGYLNEPHPTSVLQWVRPVKEFSSLLLGDMTCADGQVVEIGDVVALNLLSLRPDPVHVEDWLTDFVRRRPRLLRRLEGEKRAAFLEKHVDHDPAEVLIQQTRSLCLLRPEQVWANFSLDTYSGKYEARIGFRLENLLHAHSSRARGIPVTDLKWRALGRCWLAEGAASREIVRVSLDHDALHERLEAEAVYLSIGLSRPFREQMWALVVGVHPVPDYTATIDYGNL